MAIHCRQTIRDWFVEALEDCADFVVANRVHPPKLNGKKHISIYTEQEDKDLDSETQGRSCPFIRVLQLIIEVRMEKKDDLENLSLIHI